MPRAINLIVLHCSATPNERALWTIPGARQPRTPDVEIDAWHAERGFAREPAWRARQNPNLVSIGYHFVTARNGALFTGRHLDEVGAHAQSWNRASVGICLVGMDQFTVEQWATLRDTVTSLCKRYDIPAAPPAFAKHPNRPGVARPGVCGHRNIPGVAKSCPGFDVAAWLGGGMAPLDGHLYEAQA